METIFTNTENSQTSESHNFVFNLSQRLDLKSPNKHVSLQKISIYCTRKNITKQCKNNKLKIIDST